ncbi:transcription factor HES-7.1-like [Cynoglossus semilaevis]|uniref:Transcription factor HES-7.1-like n=1 Tax=Cynoglossus semilaevis TaxID=244447 RepID=A0A3P8W6E6_CYNSE|nr:transcription factor HES-7.1-like [Cynoglossus semilaevis]
MKLIHDSEEAKAARKILKPQIERRRRERMNHSLENLKTLLHLQRQEENQRRLEKAEILEHTVLFLQKITKEGAEKRGAEEKQSFQDGFSTCLQRAAQFLGPQGKELWLGVALQDSSSSAHVASSHSPCSQTSPLLLRNSSKPVVRLLVNKSGHTLQFVPASTPSSCVQSRRELSFSPPSTPQQSQKAVSRSSTHLPQPTSHSLWRPWP